MKPRFLHLANCTPDELSILRGMIGKRLAITDAPVAPGALPVNSMPVVRSVEPQKADPAQGEGVMVVVEVWEESGD